MASARKKLDEKNLKILRELLSQPGNKHCFDCNQRGPTYVNVTIGSFVCTTCSGMLRGLTPPHRVKSITMAAFTQEEIDFISARGNEYCKKVWLGLCEGHSMPGVGRVLGGRDEQALKDQMVSVYERKRFYINPSEADKINGSVRDFKSQTAFNAPPSNVQTTPAAFSASNNNINNNLRNAKNNNTLPAPALTPPKESAAVSDPFGSLGFIYPDNGSSQPVDNFANFDNNPVFANSASEPTSHDVVDVGVSSLSDLSGIDFNPWGNANYQPLEASPAPSCWTASGWPASHQESIFPFHSIGKMSTFEKVPPPPSEDRYAALKDLDCLMKSQLATTEAPSSPAQTSEWGQPAWTPNFDDASRMPENNFFEKTSNPFSPSNDNDWTTASSFGSNPFKTDVSWPSGNGFASNGLPASQSLNFNQTKFPWDQTNSFNQTPNPFFVNGSGQSSTRHSSNPFL